MVAWCQVGLTHTHTHRLLFTRIALGCGIHLRSEMRWKNYQQNQWHQVPVEDRVVFKREQKKRKGGPELLHVAPWVSRARCYLGLYDFSVLQCILVFLKSPPPSHFQNATAPLLGSRGCGYRWQTGRSGPFTSPARVWPAGLDNPGRRSGQARRSASSSQKNSSPASGGREARPGLQGRNILSRAAAISMWNTSGCSTIKWAQPLPLSIEFIGPARYAGRKFPVRPGTWPPLIQNVNQVMILQSYKQQSSDRNVGGLLRSISYVFSDKTITYRSKLWLVVSQNLRVYGPEILTSNECQQSRLSFDIKKNIRFLASSAKGIILHNANDMFARKLLAEFAPLH